MAAPPRSNRKKRQTQLSFSPLPSSSPAVSSCPDQIQRRAASVRDDSDMSSPAKRRRVADSGSGSSPLTKTTAGGQKLQIVVTSPSKKAAQLPTPIASSQVEMRQEEAMKSVNSNGAGTQDERVAVDSSDDDLQVLSKTESKMGANLLEPRLGATTHISIRNSSVDLSSEEDVVPVRGTRRSRAAPIQSSSDGESAPQPSQNPVTPTKRSRVTKVQDTPVLSGREEISSSEEEVISPAQRRRNTAHLPSPTKKTKHSLGDDPELDLEDELDDLKGTSDIEIRETRTRGAPENSARSIRLQRLEELRRRRAGIQEQDVQEEEDQENVKGVEQDYDDESEVSEPEPIYHAMRRGGNLDEYEDDFVDDDDDTLGVEMDEEALRRDIPIEFTRHAHKKTIEYFKDEVEWMVYNKLNPAFDRYNEIYEMAHRKLDDEFKAYAGSKFISPVWAPEFDAALKARPDFYRTDVSIMLDQICDACRRSNHPPKHKVTFTGKPYDRNNLEPIASDDEDDESDESEDNASDSTENEQNFFLGRFCCANAEMAHALYHWRYALNHNVLEWLAVQGHLTPQKIVERENMRQRKREKIANKIVDAMESTGVMRELYKQFKENLAAARDAKPARFSSHR